MRHHRYAPAASMLLVSLISYVDRSTLALLAPTILNETHLSIHQYGLIVSAFSIAYTISNPLWGRIFDRAGLRFGMAAAVACWSIASGAHAFARGFFSFAAARAALGFGEGATFPGGLRTVVQTLKPSEHGRGLAVAYSGGSLGAVLTPLIVAPIFLRWGWRASFWFTALIGAAWLLLWAFLSRRPDLRHVPAPLAPADRPSLADPRLWAFMSAYALGALPLGFVLYAGALYLAKPLGCSQELIGKLLWIPPLGWEFGYFLWGWALDRAVRRGEPRVRTVRRMLAWCAVLNLGFAAIPFLTSLAAVLAAMFLATFVASGSVVLSLAYATDVFRPANAGFLAGAGAGSWSAVVAIAMPYFGKLFDNAQYGPAFWIATAVPLLGWLLWAILYPSNVI